jgi:hypothetical protein
MFTTDCLTRACAGMKSTASYDICHTKSVSVSKQLLARWRRKTLLQAQPMAPCLQLIVGAPKQMLPQSPRTNTIVTDSFDILCFLLSRPFCADGALAELLQFALDFNGFRVRSVSCWKFIANAEARYSTLQSYAIKLSVVLMWELVVRCEWRASGTTT